MQKAPGRNVRRLSAWISFEAGLAPSSSPAAVCDLLRGGFWMKHMGSPRTVVRGLSSWISFEAGLAPAASAAGCAARLQQSPRTKCPGACCAIGGKLCGGDLRGQSFMRCACSAEQGEEIIEIAVAAALRRQIRRGGVGAARRGRDGEGGRIDLRAQRDLARRERDIQRRRRDVCRDVQRPVGIAERGDRTDDIRKRQVLEEVGIGLANIEVIYIDPNE